MREDLHEDPSVLMMARELGTRPEHIVGYCHRFWSWVSRQCNDGRVTNVTPEDIESVLNLPGFCRMLVRAGWLECHENGSQPCVEIPKFERWLSQGSKARRLTAERQKKWRNARVTKMSHDKRQKSVTREEKRRVYKKKTPYSPPEGDVLFEEFWSVFPRLRRTKKHKAAEAWQNAIKRGGDPAAMIAAAREYADSPVGRGKFVQGPAPWLNGSCWDDDRLAWQRNDNGDVRRELSTAELLGIEVTDDQP